MSRVTLTDFLLTRIAEDVAAADESLLDDGTVGTWSNWVLAECEAKRRIVEKFGPIFDELQIAWDMAQFALTTLASVYADHPDYDEEW